MAEGYGEAVSLVGGPILHPTHTRHRVLIMSSVEKYNAPSLRPVTKEATEAEKQLYPWIQTQYHSESSFKASHGFIGWEKFQKMLIDQKPQQRDQIISALGQ
jgi:hypothetical protein